MAITDARREQAYPTLSTFQIGMARRFASGEPRRFGPGDILYEIGTRNVPAWLILEGSADAIQRGGAGRSSVIATYGAGQFTGETMVPRDSGNFFGHWIHYPYNAEFQAKHDHALYTDCHCRR